MEAVFEITSETGNVQVIGSGGIGYGLSATGAVTMVNDGQAHPQPMVVVQISATGANPILAIKAEGAINIERTSVGGQVTWSLRAQSNVAIGVQYWIFDTATASMKDPSLAGVAAAVYDEFGVMTFDATMATLRIADAIETAKPSEAVPSGPFVNLADTTQVVVPAGRVYAVVQSTPCFVFTTHDTGGYSNSEQQPNTPIRDDNGGEPGAFRWRQQRLQSYQATAGYSGASTIQVGLTKFEDFHLGWQPASATPFNQVYGQPRHLIVDVTNYASAGGISPTIINVGVNATSRSVTTGGAEVITQSLTATVSGGAAPYTYLWEFVGGSGDVYGYGSATNASFQTGTSNQPAGSLRSAVFRCRVTDANGFVGYSGNVTFDHIAETYLNDFVPNALTLVALTFVSNDNHAATSDVTDLTGFNQPLTLRLQTYFVGGSMDAQAVYFYRAPLGTSNWELVATIDPRSGTPYADVVFQPNSRLHYVIDSVTFSGIKSNAFDLVVWNLSNPGGAAQLSNRRMTLTVDANDDWNKADYTPDPISVPNLTGYVTNDPALNTDGRFFQITGINATTYLRFTRDSLVQSGGIFTRRLYIYKSTTGSGGPWTQYQLGAAAGAYTDIPFNNGDWCYVAGYIDTSAGIGSASWRNYIDFHDTVTVLGRLATFDISGTVDADNNYNVGPDLTPDPLTGFGDVWAVTNDPTVWTGPVATITGISQAILLRIERYNFSGSTTHLAVHVYKDTHNGQGWQHQGSFDPRAGGLQYIDFWVNPGDSIHYAVEAGTAAGRQDAAFQMVVWNLSLNEQISVRNVTVSVDNDNNYYPAIDYSPNPISFAQINDSTFSQTNQISRSTSAYQLVGFTGAITTRIYLGYWSHNFNQFSNGGSPTVGDGPRSGSLNLDIYRNGAFVGSLTHYLYGSYSGGEQYTWRDDISFSPNDTVMFVLTLTGDLQDWNAGLDASTQGGIYFDNLTVPGERIGSFGHTLTIYKQPTGNGGGGPIIEA